MLHKADLVKRDIPTQSYNGLLEDDLVHNGVTYRGADQLGKLCRVLGKGKLEVYRDGKLSYSLKDISARAEKSLREDKGGGFKPVKYTPFGAEVFNAEGKE